MKTFLIIFASKDSIMIVIQHLNIRIANPKKFKELPNDVRNYIYENLNKGLLLFIIPDKLNDLSKQYKKAYKVGFLYDLLDEVYRDSYFKRDKYDIISNRYHIFDTDRSIITFIKIYNDVFTST